MTTGRDRMLAACRFEDVDRVPVWLMRQAGRYLPEYMQLKGERDFWTLVRDPSLASEITLQPIRRYGMDAAIIFCDILVIPDAMGHRVTYGTAGPEMSHLVASMADVEALETVDPDARFGYLAEALGRVKAGLDGQALIGFAGAPLTLAAYMVEGKISAELMKLKKLAYNEPEVLDALLERLVAAVADLLLMQVRAGADVVQLFDTWAGRLAPADYARWALPATRAVVERVKPGGAPVILYVNGAGGVLEHMADSGVDVVSIDARIDMAEARARLGTRVALQGNMDPIRLMGPIRGVTSSVRDIVAATAGRGHVLNLGHGVLPPTPPEAVAAFVDAAREG